MMMADAATADRNLMPLTPFARERNGTARVWAVPDGGFCSVHLREVKACGGPARPSAGAPLARPKVQILPREHVLAGRREHVDDLGVLGEIGFVRRVPGHDPAVARPAGALLAVEVELHPSRDHPEDLLVWMLMAGRVGPRLHAPEDDHALVPDHDATGDLVADLLLGHVLQVHVAGHHGDRHGTLPGGYGARGAPPCP